MDGASSEFEQGSQARWVPTPRINHPDAMHWLGDICYFWKPAHFCWGGLAGAQTFLRSSRLVTPSRHAKQLGSFTMECLWRISISRRHLGSHDGVSRFTKWTNRFWLLVPIVIPHEPQRHKPQEPSFVAEIPMFAGQCQSPHRQKIPEKSRIPTQKIPKLSSEFIKSEGNWWKLVDSPLPQWL